MPPPQLLKVWLEKLRSPLWTRWLGSMSNMVCTWQTLRLLAVGNSVPQVEWTEKGSFLCSSLLPQLSLPWNLEIFFRILDRMRSNTLLCLIYLLEPRHSGASHWSKFNAPLCSVDILADLSVEGLKPVAHLNDLWLSSEAFQITSSTSFSYSLMSYEFGFAYSGMPLCNCGCLFGLLMVDTTKKQSDGMSKV